MKKRNIINLLVVQFIILLAFSCKPEDGIKNPANYIDYVYISKDLYPAVSPDGSLIAYFHKSLEYPEPEDYPTGLYIKDSDGTNRRLLFKGDHWSPSWSPDGEWLVFTTGGTLQIINLEGDSIRTFQGINNAPLFFPDWSSDEESILFSSPLVEGGGFFTCNPFFLNVKQLFDQYEISGFSAKWLPDSKKIIYQKNTHDWSFGEIFIIDTAGINDIRLTENDRDDRYPSWSLNDEFIAWSSNIEIYVMNADGSNQRRLDYGRYPDWTPDSEYIIYCNANNDISKEVLWKIDKNGKNKIQLTF